MGKHIARWNSPVSHAAWLQHMETLEEFARNRNRHLMAHMMDYFSIPDTSRLTLQCGAGGRSRWRVPWSWIAGLPPIPCLTGLPVGLEALPEPGYAFTGWNGTPETSLHLVLSGDTVLSAVFEPSRGDLIPDTIRGTLVLENNTGPYFSSGTVFMPAGDTLIIREGVEMRTDARCFPGLRGLSDC